MVIRRRREDQLRIAAPLWRPAYHAVSRRIGSGKRIEPPVSVALIVVALGQSLNVSRGTNVKAASSNASAKMPVDGVSVVDFSFFSINNDNAANWASFATATTLAEGAGQSPMVGIADGIAGASGVNATYLVSIAVGARPISTLMSRGARINLYAALRRLCSIAAADGHTPKVVFYSAHGEADASAATGETTYYDRALSYYKGAQLAAAQAMNDPNYIAPIVLSYPVQSNSPSGTGANDKAIKRAIKRLGDDLDNAVCMPIYQWPCNNDRVHPTDNSYVLRGEYVGKIIKDWLAGTIYQPLAITGVTLTGSTFVATFSHNITRDATLNVGQNLNTANAEDGLEWFDNGTQIAISGLVYGANTITGTLASTPAGTLGQQELRIGCQGVTASLTSGHNNLPGSVVRKAMTGWASAFDPAYTNYDWACPQAFTGVTS